MNWKINILCLGKGVPDYLVRNNNGTFTLTQPIILPTVADDVAAYEGQGGHLTCPELYGVDLLANHPGLQHWTKKRIYPRSKVEANLVQMPYLLRFVHICYVPVC